MKFYSLVSWWLKNRTIQYILVENITVDHWKQVPQYQFNHEVIYAII